MSHRDDNALSFNIHKMTLPIGVIPAATMVALKMVGQNLSAREQKQKAI
jgi:hypothetical protein